MKQLLLLPSPMREPEKQSELKLAYSADKKQAVRSMACHRCHMKDWSFKEF